jgi:hypothetical protein
MIDLRCLARTFIMLLSRASLALLTLAALSAVPALAQSGSQVGVLSCDVSRGIGLFVVQKQTLSCTFRQDGGMEERYTGSIDQFGIALGEVTAGHLVWGVLAASKGLPAGALAGSYAGVGASASFGIGAGANILVGGTGRSFSLQPISVEGQTGVNIAGGITTLTLAPAP